MILRRALGGLGLLLGGVVALGALLVAAATLSPWPSALIIRRVFDRGGHATNAAIADLVPTDVTSRWGLVYDAGDRDARFDVHRPSEPGRYPTIVWVHGGGWVSGSRSQVSSYLRILAARGFVVVAVDYSLAPGARYPRPVHQVLTALAHLAADDGLDLDLERVVLAGDSAGSQIAAQVAAAVTDPDYAASLGVTPTLPRAHLRAAVLHCGAYDLQHHGSGSRAGTWFVESVLWAYTGHRHPGDDPLLDLASVNRHAGPDFPPTYLSGGDADPLTPQGRAFAASLEGAGVTLEADFPSGGLGHEFQFDLRTDAGRSTFERSVAFLHAHT